MATGTVKWFNETKGYGFIQPDQGGKDVFVHISAVERSGMNGLAEGMKVTYDLEADRKSGKEFRNEFEGGLIRGMSRGLKGARRPPLRPVGENLLALIKDRRANQMGTRPRRSARPSARARCSAASG